MIQILEIAETVFRGKVKHIRRDNQRLSRGITRK